MFTITQPGFSRTQCSILFAFSGLLRLDGRCDIFIGDLPGLKLEAQKS